MTNKTGLGENPLAWIKDTTKVENKKTREPKNQRSRTVEKYKSRKVENQKSRSFKDDKDQISLWLPKNLVNALKLEAVHSKSKISEVVKQSLIKHLKTTD